LDIFYATLNDNFDLLDASDKLLAVPEHCPGAVVQDEGERSGWWPRKNRQQAAI